MSDGDTKRAPPLTCRNSARVLRRPMAVTGYGTGGLMPTGACAPWLSAARAPCARLWSPCGRGSRGASCGRAATVGRCVSRRVSWVDLTEAKTPLRGPQSPGAYRAPSPLKSIDPAGIQGLRGTGRALDAASSTMPRVPRSCRVGQNLDNHHLSPPFWRRNAKPAGPRSMPYRLVRQRSRSGSRLVTKLHNGAKRCSLCLWRLPT